MENVGMLVHRGLREVLGSLAEIGYDAEWQDIRASDMGAPHRRERIWIIAYAFPPRERRFAWEKEIEKCIVADSSIMRRGEGEPERIRTLEGTGTEEERLRPSDDGTVSNTMQPGLSVTRHTGEIGSSADGIETGATINGNRWWSAEPEVGRLVDGLPGRVDRLKGLGNSIIPAIAQLLFNQIKGLL